MNKSKYIDPNIVLTIDLSQLHTINCVVTNTSDDILSLTYIDKIRDNYKVRSNLIQHIDKLISEYDIDTILIEKVKLFTDTAILYPDFSILQNVELSYGILISIEDAFMDKIKYIIEIPTTEWLKLIFNTKSMFTPDKFMAYTSLNNLSNYQKQYVKLHNFYRCLCFSKCTSQIYTLDKFCINKKKENTQK